MYKIAKQTQNKWHNIPDSRITIRRHPDTSECVGMNLILQELSSAVLVHVNATRLTVVDFAVHHRRVSTSLDLKPCYAIVVNVASIKVPLYVNDEIYVKK